MSCQTIQAQLRPWQYAILSLAGSQNLCLTINTVCNRAVADIALFMTAHGFQYTVTGEPFSLAGQDFCKREITWTDVDPFWIFCCPELHIISGRVRKIQWNPCASMNIAISDDSRYCTDEFCEQCPVNSRLLCLILKNLQEGVGGA